MDKIIALVGESGSGKTELSKLLEKEGYNIIKSYTTRPPREENEWGHIFVPDIVWRATVDFDYKSHVIAYTFFDNHHYWAVKEQYQGKGISIYAIDTAGVKELKEKVTDAEIIVVYLKSDMRERMDRMYYRKYNAHTIREKVKVFKEHIRDCENWDNDICQRLDNDREAFKTIQCDYVIDANGSTEETLNNFKEVIKC